MEEDNELMAICKELLYNKAKKQEYLESLKRVNDVRPYIDKENSEFRITEKHRKIIKEMEEKLNTSIERGKITKIMCSDCVNWSGWYICDKKITSEERQEFYNNKKQCPEYIKKIIIENK